MPLRMPCVLNRARLGGMYEHVRSACQKMCVLQCMYAAIVSDDEFRD